MLYLQKEKAKTKQHNTTHTQLDEEEQGVNMSQWGINIQSVRQ